MDPDEIFIMAGPIVLVQLDPEIDDPGRKMAALLLEVDIFGPKATGTDKVNAVFAALVMPARQPKPPARIEDLPGLNDL